MIPERPRLLASAQDPAKHARLVTDEAILAELASWGGDANAMALNGVVAFAHLFDDHAASSWIRDAARLSPEAIDAMTPAAQRAAVAALWQSFGRYWQALNVSPYAWRRLRWAFEDAFGYPRSPLDRDATLLALDTAGREAVPPRAAPDIEQREHFKGVRWTRTEIVAGRNAGAMDWDRTGGRCWSNAPPCTVDADGNDVCYAGTDDGCVYGTWGLALSALGFPALRGRWFIGRAPFVPYEPGLAPIGVPTDASRLGNTGELHRLWLWNDGTVRVDASMGASGEGTVAASEPWTRDQGVSVEPGYQRTEGWQYPVGWLPPTRWYFDLLRAPQPGLKIGGAGPDVSLVDYLVATPPAEVIREVRRDVLVRNNLMKSQRRPPILTDQDLFTRAQVEDFRAREQATRGALGAQATTQASASSIMAGVNQIATGINPMAGVLVGAASLALQLGQALTSRTTATSDRYVDVFGRLMPAFERFEITDARTVLTSAVAAMGLPPGAPPDPGVRRAAFARDLADVVAAARRGDDLRGIDIATRATRVAGRRTVILAGLDPAQGARVFAGERDLTVGLPETGGGAAWIDLAGERVWRFGVPEGTREITLRYPDGRARVVALPAVPSDADGGELDPEARTAVVDATPPVAGGEGDASAYPARTVVLAGMPADARVFAGGVDVTGRASPEGSPAQWIASTLPGVQAWLFGVPDGTRAVTVTDAEGSRTFALAPMDPTLPVRERVTPIDARRAVRGAPMASASGSTFTTWLLALGVVAGGAWFATRPRSAARPNPSPRRAPRRGRTARRSR